MEENGTAPKKKTGRRWLIGSILFLWVVAVLVAVFQQKIKRPDLFSSPTNSRDITVYKEESWLDILEKSDRSIEKGFSAKPEMAVPVLLPGKARDFVLNWEGEKIVQEKPMPDYWATGMEGGQKLELAAIAFWIPQAEDPIEEESKDWEPQLVIRDAKTLEEIGAEKLKELNFPEEFKTIKPTRGRYKTPKVRLIFQSENLEHLRILSAEGGDSRTGAVVTYSLDSIGGNEPPFAESGDWAIFDLAFFAWHDVPLRFHVVALTGAPQYAELPQKLGAQVAFEDRLRMQFLKAVDGEPDDQSELGSFVAAKGVDEADVKKLRVHNKTYNYDEDAPTAIWMTVEDSDDITTPVPLVRYNSSDYLEHVGVLQGDDSVEWEWDRHIYNDQFQAATFSKPVPQNEPLKLVFLPKRTELTFEIESVPDAPNPRDIDDLFQVRIPRITLSGDYEQAEDELIGMLSVAAQIGWEHSNLWDESPPKEFPVDRTFRDKTPQELINWYLDVTPGGRAKYDEDGLAIFVNPEEEGFWTRAKAWMDQMIEQIGIF